MHGEDDGRLAGHYGIWPTIAGVLFGGALTWLMFTLADGFA